jgi:uncharacterized protein YjiS (DUF1127 family)
VSSFTYRWSKKESFAASQHYPYPSIVAVALSGETNMKTTNVLKRIMQVLTNALERSGQQRSREYLLGLSDGHLDDIGLSRELLKQGPKAWPWRKLDEPLAALGISTVIREVNTDSGAQPADLDRGRSAIKQAARFIRPGTDTELAA